MLFPLLSLSSPYVRSVSIFSHHSTPIQTSPNVNDPGGALATSISVSVIPEFARFHEFESAVVIWLASSAIADVIITSSLVWSLVSVSCLYCIRSPLNSSFLNSQRTRKKEGYAETGDIINQIIRCTSPE